MLVKLKFVVKNDFPSVFFCIIVASIFNLKNEELL